jgi:hypothetical protein
MTTSAERSASGSPAATTRKRSPPDHDTKRWPRQRARYKGYIGAAFAVSNISGRSSVA